MLVVSIILLALCTASLAQIETEPEIAEATGERLDLRGAVPSQTVSRFITAYRDETRNLTAEDVLQDDIATMFQPVTTATPDFGYTKDAIWLKLAVRNATSGERVWRLFFRENFMQQFAVFTAQGDGAAKPLILQNELSPFSTRPIGYPELVVPFDLEPGEETLLLIRYESGGSSELSFSVETVDSFEAMTSRRTAKNFIYYGMVVLLCVIATLAFTVTRQWVFMAYTLYAASVLLFIVHADGNAFKYLWPNQPLFNAFATIPIGTALAVFCANFARVFLETKRYHPLMEKLLLAAIAAALLHLAAALFVDHQIIKKTLILVALTAILLATLSGFVAAWSRFKQVRFYLIGWTGALISASILSSRHWLGVEISEEVQFDSMRIVLVVDATLMGLAIWDNLNQGRKAQHLALKSSLLNAERNLKLTTRLHELEQQYETVLKLAQQKEHQIADTLHDLRQPLHALRLNVNNLALTGNSKADRQQIESTFGYLEKLVSGHLQESVSQLEVKGEGTEEDAAERDLKLSAVLSGIHEMFLPDAREKELDFRFVNSSLQTDADPLEVMRIVSNLVANAIKYTQEGKVLLGARRRGGKVRIEVHDTGTGMSAEEFEQARKRSKRLAKNSANGSGEGYGLSIVSGIAARRGYKFNRISNGGTGFSVGVTFPATAPASAEAASAK
ncbi:MAG: sensor histidine kinase [Nitratireductor sp.]|nr:sensor histidine kinase [Nitratireductor sp.]